MESAQEHKQANFAFQLCRCSSPDVKESGSCANESRIWPAVSQCWTL